MSLDSGRTQSIYTPPRKPSEYGTPQGKSYGINVGSVSAPTPGMNNDSKFVTYNPIPQKPSAPAVASAPVAPFGSQSGPGILESWFNQRATGTDPAFEYSLARGNQALADNYAAAGSFNSGAAAQGRSDLYANLIAQRMGQLDALAGGASAEHQGRLNAMFGQGNTLAQGQSGLASAYDLGAAGNMAAANQAQQQMYLNKAGVDQQAAQSHLNALIQGYAAYQSGKGSGGGG